MPGALITQYGIAACSELNESLIVGRCPHAGGAAELRYEGMPERSVHVLPSSGLARASTISAGSREGAWLVAEVDIRERERIDDTRLEDNSWGLFRQREAAGLMW